MKEIRFSLNAEDFRTLVRGGSVKINLISSEASVHFILSDIGFGVMQEALDDAVDGKEHYKNSERSEI